jgi:hypothetical protein
VYGRPLGASSVLIIAADVFAVALTHRPGIRELGVNEHCAPASRPGLADAVMSSWVVCDLGLAGQGFQWQAKNPSALAGERA